MDDDTLDTVRVDRWLWAARFFKTRTQAAEAIDGGKVQLNGARVKRSRSLHVGDTVRIRKPPFEWVVSVRGLAEHRRGAKEAAALFDETPDSAAHRERIRLGLKAQATVVHEGRGRPTKRDRRRIDELRGRES